MATGSMNSCVKVRAFVGDSESSAEMIAGCIYSNFGVFVQSGEPRLSSAALMYVSYLYNNYQGHQYTSILIFLNRVSLRKENLYKEM